MLFLLLLPLAWLLWRRRRAAPALVFSRTASLARGPRSGSLLARSLPVIRALALCALIVALARPRAAGQEERTTSEGIDIVIAFDISSSMLALDFQPANRLEVARNSVLRLVDRREHDRISIVSFAGEALTLVPLTTDYPVLMNAVRGMQPGQLDDGTAIGAAITTAANRLRNSPGSSRVLILFTDGVNNRGIHPRTAARAAGAFGIRIYAVGVGSMGVAPMPVRRGPAGLVYESMRVEIDDALLTEIAEQTGGRYYRAVDPQALEQITNEIDRLERTPVEVRRTVRFRELYRWPLGIALLALFGGIGLAAWRGPIP
jgi:Ca-activated chloride channel homolog